jgi:hypothetical protein
LADVTTSAAGKRGNPANVTPSTQIASTIYEELKGDPKVRSR